MKGLKLRALLAAAATAVASAALAAPASAGILTAGAKDCDTQTLSKPFSRWLDPFSYALLPGGDLEGDLTGWKLEGGARVVSGNEPFKVGGADDSRSLLLPAGSRVTTAPMCVGLIHPTMRFFARRNKGLLSTMLVEVRVETSTGLVLTLPMGADLGGGWHPSLPLPVVANLLPLLPNDRTPVAFRFTPLLGGEWQIDDVYVDPWRSS
jgi:hypothetical protein